MRYLAGSRGDSRNLRDELEYSNIFMTHVWNETNTKLSGIKTSINKKSQKLIYFVPTRQ